MTKMANWKKKLVMIINGILKFMKVIFILIFTIPLNTDIWGQTEQVNINLNDSSELILEREQFDKSGKEIEFFDRFPIAINGHPIFETDGDFPKFKLIKATLIIGQNKYDLQVEGMYNPWFGEEINKKFFKFHKVGTEMKLKGIFSSGAGTYAAEWLIVGKSSIRTILTKDEKILFDYFK